MYTVSARRYKVKCLQQNMKQKAAFQPGSDKLRRLWSSRSRICQPCFPSLACLALATNLRHLAPAYCELFAHDPAVHSLLKLITILSLCLGCCRFLKFTELLGRPLYPAAQPPETFVFPAGCPLKDSSGAARGRAAARDPAGPPCVRPHPPSRAVPGSGRRGISC